MIVQLFRVRRNRPVLYSQALKPNLLPQCLQLKNSFGLEDFFLSLTISLTSLLPYSLTIKGWSHSSKTVSAQSTVSILSFATTLFVKNLPMGQLLPNTFLQTNSWLMVSGAVYTGVEVHGMDLEISGLMEWPWLQLMCCTVCLPHGCNFRWWEEVWDESEWWLACHHWILEIEFNKRLSLLIIRLVNYSVTTSPIYKLIV